MFGRPHLARDPFEGRSAHRRYLRVQIESSIALAIAIVACGLTAAMWVRTLAPLLNRLLGVSL